MLSVMPELPGIVRELSDKGVAAEWHALARKTAVLSRFVSDPANFFEDHAWVPFDVLDFGSEDYIRLDPGKGGGRSAARSADAVLDHS